MNTAWLQEGEVLPAKTVPEIVFTHCYHTAEPFLVQGLVSAKARLMEALCSFGQLFVADLAQER